MRPYILATAFLIIAGLCMATIVFGAGLLEFALPGGLPLGNLIAALIFVGIAGAAWVLAPAGGLTRRLAQCVFVLCVAWLPVSVMIAGNLAWNLGNGRGDAWLMFSAGLLALAVLMLLVALISRVVAGRRDQRLGD